MANDPSSPHDPLTCAAIAAVAYCAANVIHEGLGHGGACLLLECRPQALNAIFFAHDETSATPMGERLIASGGGIANLITGLLALAQLRKDRPASAAARYFLWMFSAVSLLTVFGYLMFSGIGDVGDWSQVVRGFSPPWAWRLLLAAAGAVLYFWTMPRLLAPSFAHFIDARSPRPAQVWHLVRVPYLTGGTVFVAAGLLNPYGLKLVLVSAVAASFGGTSLLAWYPFDKLSPAAAALHIRRSKAWIMAGAIAVLLFIGILGPGINF